MYPDGKVLPIQVHEAVGVGWERCGHQIMADLFLCVAVFLSQMDIDDDTSEALYKKLLELEKEIRGQIAEEPDPQ